LRCGLDAVGHGLKSSLFALGAFLMLRSADLAHGHTGLRGG
jgi:hypothetical protein